jgi:hypothetical protein
MDALHLFNKLQTLHFNFTESLDWRKLQALIKIANHLTLPFWQDGKEHFSSKGLDCHHILPDRITIFVSDAGKTYSGVF